MAFALPKHKSSMTFFVFFSFLFYSGFSQAKTLIQIPVGHQHVISAPKVKRAAIGNSKVADVKALSSAEQVIVTGIRPGSTDLILWSRLGEKKTYAIKVHYPRHSHRSSIQALLKDVEGIKVKEIDKRIILDGQIYRGEDLHRIERVLKLYPKVINLTRMNAEALGYFLKLIQALLNKSKIANVSIRAMGDQLVLEGEVERKHETEHAEYLAKTIYPKIVNHLTIGIESESLILVDVKLMEVRKNVLTQAGIRWPGVIPVRTGAIFSSQQNTQSLIIGENMRLGLIALIENGQARILSNPKLLCQSGKPASFLAGGEIPIRLISERSANIIFKPYGVILNVEAKADRSQRVFLEIEAKISELDAATAVEGLPGILEHRVKTAVNINLGQTVVLGGLLENRSKKTVQKFPFLGHIPILGELFKSRSFQKNESEFLILLTPKDATSPKQHEKSILQTQNKIKKQEHEMRFSLLD